MKIYLASWYLDKLRMRSVATALQNAGCKVVSSWVFSNGEVYPMDPATLQYWAKMDEAEVRDCDLFVGFADAEVFRKGQGGRHAEFGIARPLFKPIVMVGEPEHVFHFAPEIVWVKDVAGLLQYVDDVKDRAWFER